MSESRKKQANFNISSLALKRWRAKLLGSAVEAAGVFGIHPITWYKYEAGTLAVPPWLASVVVLFRPKSRRAVSELILRQARKRLAASLGPRANTVERAKYARDRLAAMASR